MRHRFTPDAIDLVKAGATKFLTVTFNGSVVADDNGHIIFDFVEDDPGGGNDVDILEVDVPCDPLLNENDAFQASMGFGLKCTAD